MTAVHPHVAQRDDGKIPRLVGGLLGASRRLPAGLLTVAGATPLLVADLLVRDRAHLGVLGFALGWFVLLAGLPAGRTPTDGLAWLVPPLIRLTEYVTVWRLVLLTDPQAQATAYWVLAVLAYHHYDTIYRQRQQRTDPPRWLETVGGGWATRLLLLYSAAALGAPAVAIVVVAGALALVYVVESVANWAGSGKATYDEDG